jgi:hypothetical protein
MDNEPPTGALIDRTEGYMNIFYFVNDIQYKTFKGIISS